VSDPSSDEASDTVTRAQPPVTPTTQPFWDATRDRQLVLQWCLTDDHPIFFPREVCPVTLDANFEWRPASGLGTVYSFTVENRPQNPGMRSMAPYVVALIDLDEGVRLLSNVVGCAPEAVAVGMEVQVTWEPLDDGRHLPQFEPRG
jgi:uncharacterized OB-fold protein